MRSTSTSSNPGERGLFRLLVGAALAHAGWKSFWERALPPKREAFGPRANAIMKADAIMKALYHEAIVAQLDQRRSVLRDFLYKPPTIEEQVQEVVVDPLMPHEAVKLWATIRWHKYRPVIMTNKKFQEEREEYY